MLELRLRSTVVRLDFSFFAVMSLFFWFDTSGVGLSALCACFCHEMGHLIVIAATNTKVGSITLYGAGVRISAELSRLSLYRRAGVLAAGCAVNFVLFALSVLVGSYSFAAVNLVLGAFNLLPFGELDGAQLARLIAMRYLPPQKAQTLLLCLSGIGICVCAVVFISTGSSIGFTFLVTCTYIVILMGKKT